MAEIALVFVKLNCVDGFGRLDVDDNRVILSVVEIVLNTETDGWLCKTIDVVG